MTRLRHRCITLVIGGSVFFATAAHTAAQTVQPATRVTTATDLLDFGTDGLDVVPAVRMVDVSRRELALLGVAVSRERGTRRVQMIHELGECESADALPHLRPALVDADAAVRAEAVRAVVRIGNASILPDLLPLLRDADAGVRREAVLACAALGGDAAAVKAGLADADARVVAAAVAAVRSPEQVDELASRLGALPGDVRTSALRRLGELRAAERAADVARFLTGPADQRAAATRALGQMAAREQLLGILALTDDPHPTVRREAVAALPNLGVPADAQRHALERLRDDQDPTVRQSAAGVLVALPTEEGVGLLVEQLDDGYDPLRREARNALVACGDAAVPAGVALLSHQDTARRADGSYVLGRLGSAASIESHTVLLRDADWEVVRQAAWSLGRIGNRAAGATLEDVLAGVPSPARLRSRAHEQALAEAVIAAGRLGHRAALPRVLQTIPELGAVSNPAPRLRAACAWSVGALADRGDAAACATLKGILDDVLEQPGPKVEAAKALGHLRCRESADQLRQLASTAADPALRRAAHWALQRVTGKQLPYAPPTHPWRPSLSIAELSP